ncbi:hypothetical protein MLD38_036483 [Melastoma candidum]|uniref:Uncharacterized protein n=1 Tax=Melastoma candidum TaxID=119954 RepID=A0ACB9LLP1_9MYRT|nr:hypothetical protein MLD38_036483 [Melastoma candidum]
MACGGREGKGGEVALGWQGGSCSFELAASSDFRPPWKVAILSPPPAFGLPSLPTPAPPCGQNHGNFWAVILTLVLQLIELELVCVKSFRGKLSLLAILVSGGLVLQILACALYNNWWPMLSVIMYVLLPMPLLFFAGSDSSSLFSESNSPWVNATKFLTGFSAIGSIAIPAILKHAGVIGWGALALELSSFIVIVVSILCFLRVGSDNDYSIL